jgi:hypothetical protein
MMGSFRGWRRFVVNLARTMPVVSPDKERRGWQCRYARNPGEAALLVKRAEPDLCRRIALRGSTSVAQSLEVDSDDQRLRTCLA